MLTNLYFLIIIIIPLVQLAMCTTMITEPLLTNSQDTGKVAQRANDDSRDTRYFGSVLEHHPQKPVSRQLALETPQLTTVISKTEDKTYNEIKSLLAKVLEQIEEIEKRSDREPSHLRDNVEKVQDPVQMQGTTKDDSKKKRKDNDQKIKWGHWTDWSSCSVSCGKGRQIRWRHCIENCCEAETEMEEKVCQLPACAPGKLFGVIKI